MYSAAGIIQWIRKYLGCGERGQLRGAARGGPDLGSERCEDKRFEYDIVHISARPGRWADTDTTTHFKKFTSKCVADPVAVFKRCQYLLQSLQ